MRWSASRTWFVFLLIPAAIIAYLPALNLPFISDDFPQIAKAREFAARHWIPLWNDKGLAARPTYVFLTAAMDHAFGFTPRPFYIVSILLHVACTLLVYAGARVCGLDWRGAFAAAFFFAIYEGHQEAVMWLAASSDLLVFLFGVAAWICWMKWLRNSGVVWYGLAITAFVVALASKESAWITPMLMLLGVLVARVERRRWIAGIAPFVLLAGAYIVLMWIWRVTQPGYKDIRFTVSAAWPLVTLYSLWRLNFLWGLVAGAVLVWLGTRGVARVVQLATLWMVLAILPYSFITYMSRVPSRHTYLASAGLAFLFGVAALRLYDEKRRTVLVLVSVAAIAVNVETLWVKKMQQFRQRAEPSERLKQVATQAAGPITVYCTPLGAYTGGYVLRDSGAQGIFPSDTMDDHCFRLEYTDRTGRLVKLNERLP